MGLSVLVGLAGIFAARHLYLKRPEVPKSLAERWGGAYRLLYNKYYVDQAYDALFVNRSKDLATTLGAFDLGVINGVGVDGTGWATRVMARISMWWDSWIVDGLVNLAARIVWILSYPVRMLQSGRVANYALWMVFGVILALTYYLYTSGAALATLVR
jgi:NADH-quinone oxidoreductase subunit L